MSDEAYMELDIENFEAEKIKSSKDYEKEFSGEEKGKTYWFPNLDFSCEEDEFKEGFLTLSGSIESPETKKRLGYISIKIKMDSDRVLEVINDYMKRLGKLKTVIEAVK